MQPAALNGLKTPGLDGTLLVTSKSGQVADYQLMDTD